MYMKSLSINFITQCESILNIEHTNCWFLFYLLFQALSTFHYDFLLPQIGSEELSVLDKFFSVGLKRWLSRLEAWPYLHWIRARFWETIFVGLHQFVTPALGVWHLFSLRVGNPHKYIHTQYTWTKKWMLKYSLFTEVSTTSQIISFITLTAITTPGIYLVVFLALVILK